ncbi:hypothetical protein HMPREF0322_05251 [Desulfitobacterium hafniense DP7]|nr:hypothetical protein HMPREF0322_05251 [Desulfitobacterium hafniense DP7]
MSRSTTTLLGSGTCCYVCGQILNYRLKRQEIHRKSVIKY